MNVEQFTYTGSPWGWRAPGWTVFQYSQIRPQSAEEYQSYFALKDPGYRWGGEEGFPVQLVFAWNREKGVRVLSQTVDAGMRWYDERGHDYFAHVYIDKGSGWSVAPNFNPVAWFRSPGFQTAFPEEHKETALKILHGEIPAMPTPKLESLETLDDIPANPDYSDEALFERLEKGAIEKLGALATTLVKRIGENVGTPLVFNAVDRKSIDAMAGTVRLLPLAMRRNIQFATWVSPRDSANFPNLAEFAFYGTHRNGEKADEDTGVYGVLSQNGPEFKCRDDVELFKRMVDACGETLEAKDWDGLVECWKVAAGKAENAEELRKAWTEASRFGVQEIVRAGLDRFARDGEKGEEGIVLAGWFEPELRLDVFENDAKNICAGYARDASELAGALEGLKGDEAKLKFLEEVYAQADAEELLPKLAEWWLGDGKQLKEGKLPHGWEEGGAGKFATLVEEYDAIRKGEAKGTPKELLKKVQDAKTKLGGGFQGMEETLRELEYKVELEEIKSWENLPEFAERAEGMGVEGEKQKGRIKQDALKQVPLEKTVETINPEALERVANAYGMVGVGMEEVVAAIPGSRLMKEPQAWVEALSKVRVDWKKEWAALAHRAIAAAREEGRKEGRNEAAGRGDSGRKGYRREEEERSPERERERSPAEISKLETGAPVSVGSGGAGKVLAWLVACALAAAAGFGAGRWMNNGEAVEGDGVPKSEVEQMEQRWGERVERERIGRGQAQEDLRTERARADQLAWELEDVRRKEQEALERAARAESLLTGGAAENPAVPARSSVPGRGAATGRTFQEKRMGGEPVGGGGRQGGTAYNKRAEWQAEGRKASGGDTDGWSVPAMVGEDEGKGAGGVPAAVGSGE